MQETKILWADDEINLLKPHILLLNEKGYDVTTFTNGNDALEAFGREHFDLVFLDENMPGLSGIETLSAIKNIKSDAIDIIQIMFFLFILKFSLFNLTISKFLFTIKFI